MDEAKELPLKTFADRLRDAPRALTREEAYRQLSNVLNETEEELTQIPFNPDQWRTDGRMYPPRLDSIRDVPDWPRVKRYRSRGHNTFISDNGAIEIQTAPTGEHEDGEVILSKPGADGKTIWECR